MPLLKYSKLRRRLNKFHYIWLQSDKRISSRMFHIRPLYCIILLLLRHSSAAPTAIMVKILSVSTGLYVKVAEDGTISVSHNRDGAALFYMLSRNSGYQLQVKDTDALFLVVTRVDNATATNNGSTSGSDADVGAYELRTGHLLSDSTFSYWTIRDDGSGCGEAMLVLPNSTMHCYVAFDGDTLDVAGPCGLPADDPQSQICIERLLS